ncbi:MAG: TerB family tellurite resistance protein [Chlorobi bacterium]|nr:TerB family tellurite resistance protein [Chlorobiota bacterium]
MTDKNPTPNGNKEDKREQLKRLQNLLALAFADGKVTNEEIQYIINKARKAGFSDQDLQILTNLPTKMQPYIPESQEEKEEHIKELMVIMAVDGTISSEEMGLCKFLAMKMGINPDVVERFAKQFSILKEQEEERRRIGFKIKGNQNDNK